MNALDSLKASRDFVAENMAPLCAEVLAWKEGAEAGPLLRELASLCSQYVGGPHSLDAAEGLVGRAAMSFVAASRVPEGPVLPDAELQCGCRQCLRDRNEGVQVGSHFLPTEMTFMVVCGTCGNKRCPRANDHRHACSGSNLPGQPGSAD